MRSPLKALLVTGSLVAAILGAALSATTASAAEVAPTLSTTNFACSNGVCEIGPGNVGMSFAAGLDAVGQQCSDMGGTTPEVRGVASGSLPPGLQFGLPGQVATITGTPTTAGTYSFAVELANVNNASGQICGPTGTQQLTITIGTGHSDRPANMHASFNIHTGFGLGGYDANNGARWSVSVTSTGRVIVSNAPSRIGYPDAGQVIVNTGGGAPCGESSCLLTVTNSLGSSLTITLPKPVY
jgi:hypothetical protein